MPIIIAIIPMPPIISVLPKVKRGKPAGLPRPTHATSRPSSKRDHALERLVRGDEHRAGQAQQHQPEILERTEVEREIRQRRRRHDQHRGAEQAAHRREHQARAQREFGLALARHGKGFVGVGGRGRRAGDAQQAAGNVAGEDRHGRGRDHRGDGRDRRHEEGHRHQQRRRHRGRQARHRADEQAVERRDHHHRDGVRLEHHRESLADAVHMRGSFSERWISRVTRRRASARPRAAARAAACRKRSGSTSVAITAISTARPSGTRSTENSASRISAAVGRKPSQVEQQRCRTRPSRAAPAAPTIWRGERTQSSQTSQGWSARSRTPRTTSRTPAMHRPVAISPGKQRRPDRLARDLRIALHREEDGARPGPAAPARRSRR